MIKVDLKYKKNQESHIIDESNSNSQKSRLQTDLAVTPNSQANKKDGGGAEPSQKNDEQTEETQLCEAASADTQDHKHQLQQTQLNQLSQDQAQVLTEAKTMDVSQSKPFNADVDSCNSINSNPEERQGDLDDEEQIILQSMQLNALSNQFSDQSDAEEDTQQYVGIRPVIFCVPKAKAAKNEYDHRHPIGLTDGKMSPQPAQSHASGARNDLKQQSNSKPRPIFGGSRVPFLTSITTKMNNTHQNFCPRFKQLKAQNLASGNTTDSTANALEKVLSARKRSLPLTVRESRKAAYIGKFANETAKRNFDSFVGGNTTTASIGKRLVAFQPAKVKNLTQTTKNSQHTSNGSEFSFQQNALDSLSQGHHPGHLQQQKLLAQSPFFFNRSIHSSRGPKVNIINEGESVRRLLTRNGQPQHSKQPLAMDQNICSLHGNVATNKLSSTSHAAKRPCHHLLNTEFLGSCNCQAESLFESARHGARGHKYQTAQVSSRSTNRTKPKHQKQNQKITMKVSDDARITIGTTSYRLSTLIEKQMSYGQQAMLESYEQTKGPILVTRQAPTSMIEAGIRQETARQKYNLLVQAQQAGRRRYSHKRNVEPKRNNRMKNVRPPQILTERHHTGTVTALERRGIDSSSHDELDYEDDEVASLDGNESNYQSRQRKNYARATSDEGSPEHQVSQSRETKDISLQISPSKIMPDGQGFLLNSEYDEEDRSQKNAYSQFVNQNMHQQQLIMQQQQIQENLQAYQYQTLQSHSQHQAGVTADQNSVGSGAAEERKTVKTSVIKKFSDSRIVMSQLKNNKQNSPAKASLGSGTSPTEAGLQQKNNITQPTERSIKELDEKSTVTGHAYQTFNYTTNSTNAPVLKDSALPNRTEMSSKNQDQVAEFRNTEMQTCRMGELSVQVRKSPRNSPEIQVNHLKQNELQEQSIWSTSDASSKDHGTPGLRLGPTHSYNLPVDTKNGAVRITTQLPQPAKTADVSLHKPSTTTGKTMTAGQGSPGKGEYASLKVKQFKFSQQPPEYLYASRDGSPQSGDSCYPRGQVVHNGQIIPWQAAQPLKSYVGIIPVLECTELTSQPSPTSGQKSPKAPVPPQPQLQPMLIGDVTMQPKTKTGSKTSQIYDSQQSVENNKSVATDSSKRPINISVKAKPTNLISQRNYESITVKPPMMVSHPQQMYSNSRSNACSQKNQKFFTTLTISEGLNFLKSRQQEQLLGIKNQTGQSSYLLLAAQETEGNQIELINHQPHPEAHVQVKSEDRKVPFMIANEKKKAARAAELTSSFAIKNSLRINTFDMDLMSNSSLAPKFMNQTTKNGQVVQKSPLLAKTQTSSRRVKKFIELGQRIRVPLFQNKLQTPAIAITAENAGCSLMSSATNRQNMANQLRANSYIDRKSSCQDTISQQPQSAKAIIEATQRILHNKTTTLSPPQNVNDFSPGNQKQQASLLQALKIVQKQAAASPNSSTSPSTALPYNPRQLKVLESVPVTLIPLTSSTVPSNAAPQTPGSPTSEHHQNQHQQPSLIQQHLGQFVISGKPTSPVSVTSIERDLQQKLQQQGERLSLHQRKEQRMKQEIIRVNTSQTSVDRQTTRDKVISFTSSPNVKELIITYSDSGSQQQNGKSSQRGVKRQSKVTEQYFNFEENLLPQTSALRRGSQPGHQTASAASRGLQGAKRSLQLPNVGALYRKPQLQAQPQSPTSIMPSSPMDHLSQSPAPPVLKLTNLQLMRQL